MVQNLQFSFSTEEEKILVFEKATEEIKIKRLSKGKNTSLEYIQSLLFLKLKEVRGN